MFTEGRYSSERLRVHRFSVGAMTVAGLGACLAGAAFTSWPWANAVAVSALVIGFGASLWWMFASRKAGPVGVSASSIQNLKRTFWVR